MLGKGIPIGFKAPGPYDVGFLLVGGGGGACRVIGSAFQAGGGGAGGLKTSYGSVSGGQSTPKPVLNFLRDGTTYTITIGGAGGLGSTGNIGSSGTGSSIVSSTAGTLHSVSGGGRGSKQSSAAPGSGGSGGGASGYTGQPGSYLTPGSGIADEGHSGGTSTSSYSGGGGGGAGAAGNDLHGGSGLAVNILNTTNATTASIGEVSGSDTYYSGGAKSYNGGRGIGGTSASNSSYASANSGAGSAVSAGYNQPNRGGSGVVVLRMPSAGYSGVTTGNPDVYTEGSDTILVYKSSGTYVD